MQGRSLQEEGRLFMKAQIGMKNKHIWKWVVSNSETQQQMQMEKWIGAKLYRASAQFGSDKGAVESFNKGMLGSSQGRLATGKVRS